MELGKTHTSNEGDLSLETLVSDAQYIIQQVILSSKQSKCQDADDEDASQSIILVGHRSEEDSISCLLSVAAGIVGC